MISRLEFELAYFEALIEHFNFATGSPPPERRATYKGKQRGRNYTHFQAFQRM